MRPFALLDPSATSLGDGVHVVHNVSPQQNTTGQTDPKAATAERTYVLDTSVLLSDPKAVFRFAEHAVVLPVVVISELESKRNDPEIGRASCRERVYRSV